MSLGGFPATSAAAQVTYNATPAPTVGVGQPDQPDHRGGVRVSLTLVDSTVEYALNEMARQAHMRVAYNDRVQEFGKRVRVWVVDVDVQSALSAILRGTGLVGKVMPDGETILVGPRASGRERVMSGLIVGRVTDSASGQGLGGASVRIQGIKLSAVTSDSGNFTLRDVPAGEQLLTVKLFGYKPAERTVTVVDSQRTIVRIALVSVPTVLSGVVTTATGTQRKIEVGNDITTLKVDSIMRVAPIMTVTDLLETRVPGLTVLHSSGAPGDPSRIRIRGASSIYGNNDPIIIIDGIRMYSNQSDPRNDNLAPSTIGRTQ